MTPSKVFDVIIIGGNYSGLAAGMALGRALKNVLIMDGGEPCNRQTPYSHNFITHDGRPPHEIAALARQQVAAYDTVHFFNGLAVYGTAAELGFEISASMGEIFKAKQLIFAAGIRDILPDIDGFAACWGISVLHCPYCHGYEVRNRSTGILANGDMGYEFATLIFNWTNDLTLFTNGSSTLTDEQATKLERNGIKIVTAEIERLEHNLGHLENIVFKDGTRLPMEALYARCNFEQSCTIPQALGCALTEEGYIKTDGLQKTSIPGIYACGDSTNRLRTVANSVATGTTAGMMANREMVDSWWSKVDSRK